MQLVKSLSCRTKTPVTLKGLGSLLGRRLGRNDNNAPAGHDPLHQEACCRMHASWSHICHICTSLGGGATAAKQHTHCRQFDEAPCHLAQGTTKGLSPLTLHHLNGCAGPVLIQIDELVKQLFQLRVL